MAKPPEIWGLLSRPLEVTFEHQHSYSISSECRSAAHTWNYGYLVSLVLTKMAVCRFAYWVPPSRMGRNPWRFDTPATGGSAALTPGEEPNVGGTQIMGRSCSPLARGGTFSFDGFRQGFNVQPSRAGRNRCMRCTDYGDVGAALARGEEPFAAISGLFRFSCRPCAWGGTFALQEFTHNGSAALAPGEAPASAEKPRRPTNSLTE